MVFDFGPLLRDVCLADKDCDGAVWKDRGKNIAKSYTGVK